ncbi:MAG: hypothetical protein SGILL_003129 [Bacillariaceae sp.]
MKQSMQTAAPGAKSMKMVNALDPFEGFLGRENNTQGEQEEQQQLTQAMDSRLRIGSNNNSHLSMPPPSQAMVQEQQQQQHQPAVPAATGTTMTPSQKKKKKDEEESDGSDDSDLEEFDDDDAILAQIRQKRLAQLKNAHSKKNSLTAAGHGQVRRISQDEFLQECTSSKFVVVHFLHKEFERCKILSHHLKKIASSHLSAKFVEIDAEKAPFFVVKLQVQTLPTLIVFQDGKAVARLTGFDELMEAGDNNHTIDEFPTSRLGYWLQEKTGCIEYEGGDDDDDDKEEKPKTKSSSLSHRYAVYDEDV